MLVHRMSFQRALGPLRAAALSVVLLGCSTSGTRDESALASNDSTGDAVADPMGTDSAVSDTASEDATLAEDMAAPDSSQTPDSAVPPTSDGRCDAAINAEQRVMYELQVNGVTRQYRLSLPEAPAGQRLPILFAFQGGDGGDSPFPQQAGFNDLVNEESVVMVYPIAQLVPPNEGAWQLNTSEDATQDIDFVGAIIDELALRYCIDLGRVYATGYSLGSMFTYEIPCQLSSRFAAVASYAGTMPVNPSSCATEPPLAIMHIHGRADGIIPYDSTWDWKSWDSVGTMRDIPGLIEFWRGAYSCSSSSTPSEGQVSHVVHEDCNGGVRVEHYGLAGVGHEWPSAIGSTPTYQVIWNFVNGFTKPDLR